jgi:hypothetical protein
MSRYNSRRHQQAMNANRRKFSTAPWWARAAIRDAQPAQWCAEDFGMLVRIAPRNGPQTMIEHPCRRRLLDKARLQGK